MDLLGCIPFNTVWHYFLNLIQRLFLLFVLIAALKFHTLDTVEASAKIKKNNKKLLCNHFERSVEQLSGWCEKRCLAADSVALFILIELKSINTSGAMDISYNM